MARRIFKEVSVECPVEVMGCVFPNLKAIRMAVGKYARIGDPLFGKRSVFDGTPKDCPDGIYVLQMYEPYPCFDSDDFANEDRDYCNYFFSNKPFTAQQIEQLAHIKPNINSRIVNERTPEWAFPAVYYQGDGNIMIVATLE